MDHLDSVGSNTNADITAVLPLAQSVYTGDEDGRVVSSTQGFEEIATDYKGQYEWDCIQRQ